jgi:O-antigen biosynthesis protein
LKNGFAALRECLVNLRSALQGKGAAASAGELLALIDDAERSIQQVEGEHQQLVRWVKRLDHNLRIVNAHVVAIENSLIFRILRRSGAPLLAWKAKAGQILLHSPLHPLYLKLRPPGVNSYARWADRQASSGEPVAARPREEFGYSPVLSVVMPVYRPSRDWLEQAVRSVREQSYPNWELCICDDASESWVQEYFAAQSHEDPRIRFVHSPQHLGISGALNRALSVGSGEFLAFLDQDDTLSPHALEHIVEALQQGPADLIYSDEDVIDQQGRPVRPGFKPDWSPDLLLSCMYLGHLLVVSRSALVRSGTFRTEFDGAQDYDLALRVTDQPAVVRHIPRILYHWRMHQGSTAQHTSAKPYTHEAGRRALEAALGRRGWKATVNDGEAPNLYRLRWISESRPLVSLIICSRSPKLLERCLRAIQKRTDYPQRQIIVVHHVSGQPDGMRKVLERHQTKWVRYEGAFNFSRMNNRGAEIAQGEILVFLNDDVEPLDSSWLSSLVGQAMRPEIGVVGAQLVYPSGALQHAGIAIGIGDGCGHPGRGSYGTPFWNWTKLARNVSAVTGACLAIRKNLFQQVGGFDPAFPVNYNDCDLCLRVQKAGFRVVFDPALLRHYECQTRRGEVSFAERERWYVRWSAELDAGDPLYSPHLTHMREDASLRDEE